VTQLTACFSVSFEVQILVSHQVKKLDDDDDDDDDDNNNNNRV